MGYELKNEITTAIKNKTLCQYLLSWLEIEFKLDSLPNASPKITREVITKKIQDCLKIEMDMSQTIEIENLLPIIGNIIVNLSKIFSGRLDRIEYKKNYTEIKDNIVNIIKYPESFFLPSDKYQCLELIDKLFLKIHKNNENDNLSNILNLNKEIFNAIINFKKSIRNDDLITNNSKAKISKFPRFKSIFLESITSTVKKKCKEFIEKNTNRVTDFFSENSETDGICEKINEEHDTTKFKALNQTKEQLLLIKEKLNVWNLMLIYYTQQPNNEIDTVLIDLEHGPEFLVSVLSSNIDEKFSELIRQILYEFEKINACIYEKGYWLEKSAINKPGFAKKLLQHGYFNIDFSIKKIKAKLGEAPSFSEITDFISKQSFWTLLFAYGIVRWPWMNKVTFAHNWAEQLCLPEVISETEKLRTLDCKEKFLEKVITLSKVLPYKNLAIVQILNDFKIYIVSTLESLEAINQKFEDSLTESNYATQLNSPTHGFFYKKFIYNAEINSMTNPAILLSTH